MDVYRRLTRGTSLEILEALQKDVADAFDEPPRQAVILFALTELRLLAGMFGIESMIRKMPDCVMTVRDAARAQQALAGAAGTLRVIDERTVYLRMPPTYMEPETLLMVLRNLMRTAHDRERGILPPAPAPTTATPPLAASQPGARPSAKPQAAVKATR
jgi:transcription-repair coupling factor (superfamily II helicase)